VGDSPWGFESPLRHIVQAGDIVARFALSGQVASC
jgi:hypothetical protein